MKICTKCGESLPLTAFGAHATSRDGARGACKKCYAAQQLAYHYKNRATRTTKMREAHAAKLAANPNWHAENYAANREKMLAGANAYYRANRKQQIAKAIAHAAQNKAQYNAYKKAYKASKIRACPAWVRNDADLMWILAEAYDIAALRTNMLGFQWHVDHVVPLRGEKVSGLHVPWNVQVIPGSENCSKQNKFEVA